MMGGSELVCNLICSWSLGYSYSTSMDCVLLHMEIEQSMSYFTIAPLVEKVFWNKRYFSLE